VKNIGVNGISPNLLQQKISQGDPKQRASGSNQTWHRIWEFAEEGDVEDWEFFCSIAESSSEDGTYDGTEWPKETPNRHYNGLIR
jgi:phage terminase large subunit-like protein